MQIKVIIAVFLLIFFQAFAMYSAYEIGKSSVDLQYIYDCKSEVEIMQAEFRLISERQENLKKLCGVN